MLSAISYLHANGIVHRDLKLENFIFSGPEDGEGKIKLIDFGLSRACLESEVMTADVGSVIYKAPEVTVGKYSEASDLWSLGVICHMLVTGIVPWEGNTRVEIEASIKKEISDPQGSCCPAPSCVPRSRLLPSSVFSNHHSARPRNAATPFRCSALKWVVARVITHLG